MNGPKSNEKFIDPRDEDDVVDANAQVSEPNAERLENQFEHKEGRRPGHKVKKSKRDVNLNRN